MPEHRTPAQRMAAGETVDAATFSDVLEARSLRGLPLLSPAEVARARRNGLRAVARPARSRPPRPRS